MMPIISNVVNAVMVINLFKYSRNHSNKSSFLWMENKVKMANLVQVSDQQLLKLNKLRERE